MRALKCPLSILLFFLLLFSGCVSAEGVQSLYISATFDSQMNSIQNAFSNVLPKKETIIYTKVPRGLVLSIAEKEFFSPLDYHIKPSGKQLLNSIISVLQEFKNDCTIESHTDENIPANSEFHQDWELAIMRANAIAEYIVKKGHIDSGRVFPLGFGEIMPFKENVSPKGFSDKRVDFVIFDYDLKR